MIPGLLLVFWISTGNLLPGSQDTRLIKVAKWVALSLMVIFALNDRFAWYVSVPWVKNLGGFSFLTLALSVIITPVFYLISRLNLRTIKKVRDMMAFR